MWNQKEMDEFLLSILNWYEKNAKSLPWRENIDPYRVLVSEVMLQQTRIEFVKNYYIRFLEECPTVFHLADLSEEKLLKLWQGLGYYNRARNLQKTAKWIAGNGGFFPAEPKELQKLPGVGEYIAGAIASICFNKATPAIDGNVLRVFSRLYALPLQNNPKDRKMLYADLSKIYAQSPNNNHLTQAIMELGEVICLPKGIPLCLECPLAFLCKANREGMQKCFPIPLAKAQKKVEQRTVFVLDCNGFVALEKRSSKGLLASLWQFPNVPRELSAAEAQSYLQKNFNLSEAPVRQKTKKHIFSHLIWEMTIYYFTLPSPITGFHWADKELRNKAYPLPSAFQGIV